MAKRKSEDQAENVESSGNQPEAQGDTSFDPSQFTEGASKKESTFVKRFGEWTDFETNVGLTEDRQNNRMLIRFGEKPSEAVRTLLKQEYGYKFDPDDQVWYKRIDKAKPRQTRDEAQELAFKVGDMVREEKGLEPKWSAGRGI